MEIDIAKYNLHLVCSYQYINSISSINSFYYAVFNKQPSYHTINSLIIPQEGILRYTSINVSTYARFNDQVTIDYP